MDVVVGKEGHNTRIFTGELSQVVFNPNWNIPRNIVEKEISTGNRKRSLIILKKKIWKS